MKKIKIKCKNCEKEYMTFPSKGNTKIFCSSLCHSTFKKTKMLGNKYGKGQPAGENNPNWKGENVSYSGIHKWIARKLGTPRHCANCGTTNAKKFEWANISRSYKREFSDWIRLCSKCHINFDKGNLTLTIS